VVVGVVAVTTVVVVGVLAVVTVVVVVVVVPVVADDDELLDTATTTAIAVAVAETARKNSAGRIQALVEVMTPAGTASIGDCSARGGRQPPIPGAQRWMTTRRSSVISRTAYAGPSFVFPEAFTPP
jgi:hypothetical protein